MTNNKTSQNNNSHSILRGIQQGSIALIKSKEAAGSTILSLPYFCRIIPMVSLLLCFGSSEDVAGKQDRLFCFLTLDLLLCAAWCKVPQKVTVLSMFAVLWWNVVSFQFTYTPNVKVFCFLKDHTLPLHLSVGIQRESDEDLSTAVQMAMTGILLKFYTQSPLSLLCGIWECLLKTLF